MPPLAYVQSPGTSGQKPLKPVALPATGKFGTNAPQPRAGLLTPSNIPAKPVTSQATPSMAQVQVGMMNTPFNASPATQPAPQPIGQKAISANDGLKKPETTLPAQFKAKAVLKPGDGLKKLEDQTQVQNQQYTQANQVSQSQNENKNSLYGGLIGQLANRGLGDSPEVQQAREALKQSQLKESQVLNANKGVDMNSGMAQDARERALFGNEQNALSQQLGSAVTTQGQQIGALQGAAGLAQPVGQFGLLTNPITGTPLNMGVFQSAIQQAQQLVQAGTPVNDPSVQALLSPFGFVGPLAFNQAMQAQSQGGWNPAAQNATQGQAISQGVGSQGQAYQLDTGLKQLKTLAPVVSNFMAQSNINSTDSPLYNAQIGTYLSQLGNPGQWNQFQNMMGELRKFQSQLLASGSGGIPTDISNTINSTDISKLSLKDIRTAMETMDILGNNQVSVLQNQGNASLGGGLGYSGSPANPQTSVPAATPSTAFGGQVQNPVTQAGIGAGLNFGPELAKWGAGIWTAIKSFGL